MFKKLKGRLSMFSRDIKGIKKIQIICLEIKKTAISEMKNKLDGIRQHRERNSELDDTAIATIQNKIERRKTKEESTSHGAMLSM